VNEARRGSADRRSNERATTTPDLQRRPWIGTARHKEPRSGKRELKAVAIDHMHPSWKQLTGWVVFMKTDLIERIVIARKENNRAAPTVSDRERLGETPSTRSSGFRCYRKCLQPTTPHRPLCSGERQDLLDDCESRARELTAIVSIELAELAAQSADQRCGAASAFAITAAISSCTSGRGPRQASGNAVQTAVHAIPVFSSRRLRAARSAGRSRSA
jgi:hypothetical protein